MKSEPKLIGKGKFTKVYKFTSRQVILKSTDPVKEAMALGFFPKSNLFPNIQFFDSMKYNDFQYIAYYDKDLKETSVFPKLNAYYKNMYRELRKMEFSIGKKDFYIAIDSLKGIKKYHLEALKKAFEAITNYVDEEDIKFEISPRNVSTRNGRLILNDCFYVTTAESIF